MNKTKAIEEIRRIFRIKRRTTGIAPRKIDLNRRETDIERRTETPREKKRARKQFQEGDRHTRPGRLKAEPEAVKLYRLSSIQPLKPGQLVAIVVVSIAVVLLLMYLYEQHVYYSYDLLTGQRPGVLDSVVPSTH